MAELDLDNPDDLALLQWIIQTYHYIRLELEVAGIKTGGYSDIPDDAESVYLEFTNSRDVDRFLEMIDWDTMPHADEWGPDTDENGHRIARKKGGILKGCISVIMRQHDDGSFSAGIMIPRSDLGIAHERLKRWNAANVPNYVEKKQQVIERKGCTDA